MKRARAPYRPTFSAPELRLPTFPQPRYAHGFTTNPFLIDTRNAPAPRKTSRALKPNSVSSANALTLNITVVMRGFDFNAPSPLIKGDGAVTHHIVARADPGRALTAIVTVNVLSPTLRDMLGDDYAWINQTLTALAVVQPFGGFRWFWLCPSTGKKCTTLYLPEGAAQFRSRQGHSLAKDSDRAGPIGRAQIKADRLYALLGGAYDPVAASHPPKPAAMHWRSYHAICDELDALEKVLFWKRQRDRQRACVQDFVRGEDFAF